MNTPAEKSETRNPKPEINPKSEPEIRSQEFATASNVGCSRTDLPSQKETKENDSPPLLPSLACVSSETPPPQSDVLAAAAAEQEQKHDQDHEKAGAPAQLPPPEATNETEKLQLILAPTPSLPSLPSVNAEQAQQNPAASSPPKEQPIVISSVLGEISVLTDAERMNFMACETVLEMDTHSFVEKGRALALIRTDRLYRESGKYKDFEHYCQKRWQYGSRYVNRVILASQMFTHLGSIWPENKPDHESQLRPLTG